MSSFAIRAMLRFKGVFWRNAVLGRGAEEG
jgi:hypothetical protein